MGFEQLAKNLLQSTAPKLKASGDDTDILTELRAANFERSQLLQEYRNLYDSTDNPAVRRQILQDIAKIQNLMSPDEKKEIPQITINVFGDNTRVGAMLCPDGA